MRRSVLRRATEHRSSWRALVTRDARRAIDASDRLVDRNRVTEALRLLVVANRRLRDPEIAAKIVDLRFDAFRRTTPPRGGAPLLAAPPELFGAALPEVKQHELTADRLRSAINHHAYLLVRGFADQRDVDLLAQDIERAFSACDAALEHGSPTSDDRWFRLFAPDRTSDREQNDPPGVCSRSTPLSRCSTRSKCSNDLALVASRNGISVRLLQPSQRSGACAR